MLSSNDTVPDVVSRLKLADSQLGESARVSWKKSEEADEAHGIKPRKF